jgi:hypothetical protein
VQIPDHAVVFDRLIAHGTEGPSYDWTLRK